MSKNVVRESLVVNATNLLLGPISMTEKLESNPSDTYVTGILWPKGSIIPEAEDDTGNSDFASDDADSVEMPVPGYRAIRPCSIGLTCTVDAGIQIEVDLDGTARYIPQERIEIKTGTEADSAKNETQRAGVDRSPEEIIRTGEEADSGKENTREFVRYDWLRNPIEYRVIIPENEKRETWRTHDFLLPDGKIINDPDLAVDIKRRVLGGHVVFTATLINLAPQPEGSGPRDQTCTFQSRLRIRASTSSGSPSIRPRESYPLADDEDALTNLLLYRNVYEFAVGHGISAEWSETEGDAVHWVATSWMPRSVVTGTSSAGHQSLREFTFGGEDPFSAEWLSRENERINICKALDAFCEFYSDWIAGTLNGNIGSFSGDFLKAAQGNLERCYKTLERMRKGADILRTADKSWQAFVLANRAMDDQSRLPSKGDKARPLVWRPFQLAFLLLVIPSVADGKDPDRDTMDLLWFPTGGGKTEAYLGLAAFQIFLRRLENQVRRDHGGVDVIMRYTLRLLTVQQFQRAAALVCACELIRAKNQGTLGSARITLGLYVGDDSTPNRLADAEIRLAEERQGQKPKSTPRQLLKCPVCGANLPVSSYRVLLNAKRMETVCPSAVCPTAGQPLPVMTVDEVIYESPPSLLIGTIDKFAQLPRRTDIRRIFGLDTDVRPGLIIQDELHLISGPLGSVTGLYEAAIDLICTTDGVRPKIVGSTATIGRARRQVRALFDRHVLQFPPPGFDAADSFFAVKDDISSDDRTYIGVSSAGRSPKFALQAIVAVVLQSAATLREAGGVLDADIDPYWTCVVYFNSLRELGGAHVLMLDDVPRQMNFISHRLNSTVREIQAPPRELSSRVSSREIPEVLLELERTLGASDPFAPEPVHAVLASNMISVGVDISRLGLMIVNGQPKSTAEYIQATSRVGRGQPGLVITLYNFGRPRDVSHFEHFQSYHGALYRGVEATSVTPWAPRARDKALHAVFISLVRHLIDGLLEDESAIDFDGASPKVKSILDYLVSRAKSASAGLEDEDARKELNDIVRTWVRRGADSKGGGNKLRYWEKHAPFGRTAPYLMRSAEEMKGQGSTAWATPNSMREVEPSTAFVLKRITRRQENEHGDASQ